MRGSSAPLAVAGFFAAGTDCFSVEAAFFLLAFLLALRSTRGSGGGCAGCPAWHFVLVGARGGGG